MSDSLPKQSSPDDQNRALLSLLLKYQRAIYSYIRVLHPSAAEADDLLQETCLTIYEKFHEFEEGTDFLRWANRIAYWKVRQSRQKFARSKVVFDEPTLEAVSETAAEMSEEIGRRHEVLQHCLAKLNERDRRMILSRYEAGGSVDEAAQRSGRTKVATYKALSRIRQLLHDCVEVNMKSFPEEGLYE